MNWKKHKTKDLSWEFLKELRRHIFGRGNNMAEFLALCPTLDSVVKLLDERIRRAEWSLNHEHEMKNRMRQEITGEQP